MKRVLAVVACSSYCLVLPSTQASSAGPAGGASAGAAGGWRPPPDVPIPRGSDRSTPLRGQSGAGSGGGTSPDGNYYAPPPSNADRTQQLNVETSMEVDASMHPPQQHDPHHVEASNAVDDRGGHHEASLTYQQQQQQQQEQHQMYRRPDPYPPQQSRWAGQYGTELPPSHHQQQQQPSHPYQQQHGQHFNSPPPYQPQPLRLGTKWRSMVTRVKDAVRPGQPMAHREATYHGGGGGGASQDGNVGRMYPSASPPYWEPGGGARQNNGGYYHPPDEAYKQPYTAGGTHRTSYDNQNPSLDGYHRQPDAFAGSQGGYGNQRNDGGVESLGPYGEQQQNEADGSSSPAFFSGAQPPMSPSRGRGGADDGNRGGEEWQPSSPPESFFVADGGNGGAHGMYTESRDQMVGRGGETCNDSDARVQHERPGVGQDLSTAYNAQQQAGRYEEQQQPVMGNGWAAATAAASYAASPSEREHDRQRQYHQQQEEGQTGALRNDGETLPARLAPHPPRSEDSSFPHGSAAAEDDVAPWDKNGSDDMLEATATVTAPTKPSKNVETNLPAGGSTSWGGVESAQSLLLEKSNDPMPSSADHGMEMLDWGEEEEEDMLPEMAIGPGGGVGRDQEEQREEEALIRELERMDSLGGGEESLASVTQGGNPEVLDVVDSDEAVENALDLLFDGINSHDSIGNGIGFGIDAVPDDFDVAQPFVATETAPLVDDGILGAHDARADGAEVLGDGQLPARSQLEDCAAGVEDATVGTDRRCSLHREEDMDERLVGEEHDEEIFGDAPAAMWSAESGAEVEEKVVQPVLKQREPNAVAASIPTPIREADTATGKARTSSLWGTKGRWASLPIHAIVVSNAEGGAAGRKEDNEQIDDEDEVDLVVPLDPIQLPPSAASDEIWNDQHLQEQLDAYWEQNRGTGSGSGSGSGSISSGVSSLAGGQSQVQQLSRFPGNLQATYGPGDWVGRVTGSGDWAGRGAALGGTDMVSQEPLPGTVVDGIPRAGNNWVNPSVFAGNQGPVNIYGDLHVHLPASQEGYEISSPGMEDLRARERYYSQGETSWSGSQGGSH